MKVKLIMTTTLLTILIQAYNFGGQDKLLGTAKNLRAYFTGFHDGRFDANLLRNGLYPVLGAALAEKVLKELGVDRFLSDTTGGLVGV